MSVRKRFLAAELSLVWKLSSVLRASSKFAARRLQGLHVEGNTVVHNSDSRRSCRTQLRVLINRPRPISRLTAAWVAAWVSSSLRDRDLALVEHFCV